MPSSRKIDFLPTTGQISHLLPKRRGSPKRTPAGKKLALGEVSAEAKQPSPAYPPFRLKKKGRTYVGKKMSRKTLRKSLDSLHFECDSREGE